MFETYKKYADYARKGDLLKMTTRGSKHIAG